jgi:hypothetical protein
MRRRSAAALAMLAVAGLVVAATVLGGWWSARDGSTATAAPITRPVTAPTTAPTTGPTTATATPPRGAVRGRPVRLRMASIDVDSRIRPVGVRDDRQMALPDEPWVLGWYRFGPAPGAGVGSVVLAGHLDSRRYGVGPLVTLRDTEVGDPVTVTSADGTTADYRVVRVERFDRQALPAELFARTGRERLRIITCGGGYDPGSGYEQNLVVTAIPA